MARILIIDDDKLIRWSLSELFRQENHLVDSASSYDEALNFVKENPYQLVISDMELNEMIRGDLLEKIQELQPHAKIIIISALNRKVIDPKIGNVNVEAVFEKPFESESIRTLAENLLNQERG